MNQSRLSKLLAKLIHAGLVKETIDSGDRRLQFLIATESGSGQLRFLEPTLSDAAVRVLTEGTIELLP